jgi:hypothetical protein
MRNLRHFYSTTLQDAGVSPVAVTEFLGHSKKALPVTFRVYGHVTEETFDQARQAVDSTLFRLRPVESGGTVTELRRHGDLARLLAAGQRTGQARSRKNSLFIRQMIAYYPSHGRGSRQHRG